MNTNTDIRIAVSFRGHRKRRKLRMLLGAGSTDYLVDLAGMDRETFSMSSTPVWVAPVAAALAVEVGA